jgi:hypothetical protein
MGFSLFSRRRRLMALLLVMTVAAVVAVPAALAWSENYVNGTTSLAPAQYVGSDYNSNLHWNAVQYTVNYTGDAMGVTLCYTNGSCYTAVKESSGGADTRSISYGNAWCGGWASNHADVNATLCTTNNQ